MTKNKLKLTQVKLNPKAVFSNDYVFKRTIANPEENYANLRAFAHSVIGGPNFKSCTISNSEEARDYINDKNIRYDIKAVLDNNTIIDIEIQKAKDEAELKDRIAYYSARLFSHQEAKGQDYNQLLPTYTIFICDFPVFKDGKRWFERYRLRGEENFHDILTSKLNCFILEIGKTAIFDYDTPVEQLEPLKRWQITLATKNHKKIEEIAEIDPNIDKVVNDLIKVNQDLLDWLAAESKYKHEVDAEHEKRKRERELNKSFKSETALRMINNGLGDDIIIQCLDISLDELTKIKNSLR